MLNIKPGMVSDWIGNTNINKPASEVLFGKYRIYLDEGIILMKNTARGQIDIISNLKIGLKNALSENGRLLLSEIIKKNENEGNAGFFILDGGYEKATYVSITYGDEGAQIRSKDYGLGFALSDDYDASACEGTLIVIDRTAQRYRMNMADGNTLSANLPLTQNAKCFMVSRDIGLITDENLAYVVHDSVRDFIDLKKLIEQNGSALIEPWIGVGFADEHWLVVKNSDWEKSCLAVALGGKEKFCYEFCQLANPFEIARRSESIMKK